VKIFLKATLYLIINVIIIEIILYVFERLHSRQEFIIVSLSGLIYTALRGQDISNAHRLIRIQVGLSQRTDPNTLSSKARIHYEIFFHLIYLFLARVA
jgi:hypothetical protein